MMKYKQTRSPKSDAVVEPSGSVRRWSGWYQTIKKQTTALFVVPKVTLIFCFLNGFVLHLFGNVKRRIKKQVILPQVNHVIGFCNGVGPQLLKKFKKRIKRQWILPQVNHVIGFCNGVGPQLLKKFKRRIKRQWILPQVNLLIGLLNMFGLFLLKSAKKTLEKKRILPQAAACFFLLLISISESKHNDDCSRHFGERPGKWCRGSNVNYFDCSNDSIKGSLCMPWRCVCDGQRTCPKGQRDEEKDCLRWKNSCGRVCVGAGKYCWDANSSLPLMCNERGEVYWNHCHYRCLLDCPLIRDDLPPVFECALTRTRCFKLYESFGLLGFPRWEICTRDGLRYLHEPYLYCDRLAPAQFNKESIRVLVENIAIGCSSLSCITDWQPGMTKGRCPLNDRSPNVSTNLTKWYTNQASTTHQSAWQKKEEEKKEDKIEEKLSTTTLILIVVLPLVFLLGLIAAALLFFCKRRKNNGGQGIAPEGQTEEQTSEAPETAEVSPQPSEKTVTIELSEFPAPTVEASERTVQGSWFWPFQPLQCPSSTTSEITEDAKP